VHWGGHLALDLGPKLRGHPLVGIDAQHPIEAAAGHGVVAQAAEALELLLEDVRRVAAGDLDGAVGARRIDDDDLLGPPGDGLQAGRDVGLLVQGDDVGRKR
jgi:hypothetical protein